MTRLFQLLCVATLVSCTCSKFGNFAQKTVTPPDARVREFVELSAGASGLEDKVKIQNQCTGDLRRTFERMNDDAFRLIYLDSKVNIVQFKVLESLTWGQNARVHYEVSIENNQGTDPTKETNEREVDLKLVQGAWAIETIRTKGTDRIAFTRGMIF